MNTLYSNGNNFHRKVCSGTSIYTVQYIIDRGETEPKHYKKVLYQHKQNTCTDWATQFIMRKRHSRSGAVSLKHTGERRIAYHAQTITLLLGNYKQ